MPNRHERRKAARRYRVVPASGTTKLPTIICTPFDETPSLNTLSREARRMYVVLLLAASEHAQANGIMAGKPTWRIAAWLYRLCRAGLARMAQHPDGSFSVQFPRDAEYEWVH